MFWLIVDGLSLNLITLSPKAGVFQPSSVLTSKVYVPSTFLVALISPDSPSVSLVSDSAADFALCKVFIFFSKSLKALVTSSKEVNFLGSYNSAIT